MVPHCFYMYHRTWLLFKVLALRQTWHLTILQKQVVGVVSRRPDAGGPERECEPRWGARPGDVLSAAEGRGRREPGRQA
eukprot:580495-Prymnesium_polylepis.1